jgi:hypothetical protein
MWSLRVWPTLVLALATLLPAVALAQRSSDDNVRTCLSGRFPTLCDYSRLSPSQAAQARAAERAENLRTCLTGRYPVLCRRDQLSEQDKLQVARAEAAENLRTCLTGRYPILCKKQLLTSSERGAVAEAERRENLRTCLAGRYPILCKKELLSPAEREQVASAERSVATVPPGTLRGAPRVRGSACEDGHWIESVTDDGDIIKLEDGSVWEVDAADQVVAMLWLPTTEITVCGDKLINTDDDETVIARRLR